MHLPVLAIFGKYRIRHILCGYSKIVTRFQKYYLLIRFEIFWQSYNIFKEYFYNVLLIFRCCVGGSHNVGIPHHLKVSGRQLRESV